MKSGITICTVAVTVLILFGCGDPVDDQTDTTAETIADTTVMDICTDSTGTGDYDGTCYDCNTVCVNCNETDLGTCMTECNSVQGYSDGFMWLESQLHKWGCDEDSTAWQTAACPG